MIDLRHYGDNELSDRVFNDEYFYTERGNTEFLLALLAEEFLYTTAQLAELKQDLIDDAGETGEQA